MLGRVAQLVQRVVAGRVPWTGTSALRHLELIARELASVHFQAELSGRTGQRRRNA